KQRMVASFPYPPNRYGRGWKPRHSGVRLRPGLRGRSSGQACRLSQAQKRADSAAPSWQAKKSPAPNPRADSLPRNFAQLGARSFWEYRQGEGKLANGKRLPGHLSELANPVLQTFALNRDELGIMKHMGEQRYSLRGTQHVDGQPARVRPLAQRLELC